MLLIIKESNNKVFVWCASGSWHGLREEFSWHGMGDEEPFCCMVGGPAQVSIWCGLHQTVGRKRVLAWNV